MLLRHHTDIFVFTGFIGISLLIKSALQELWWKNKLGYQNIDL